MITALIFTAQNHDGESYEAIFDISSEASETISGVYTALIQSATELTSDSLLCSIAHEEKLKSFGEVEDFDSFRILAGQIEKARTYAKCPVTVSLETRTGRSTKKTTILTQFKGGLSKLVTAHLKTLENSLLEVILSSSFKAVGIELMSELINEGSPKLMPKIKTGANPSVTELFQKYVSENSSNVVGMDDDEDFEEIEEA